jgi:hypothetical protein
MLKKIILCFCAMCFVNFVLICEHPLVTHVVQCVEKAERRISKLDRKQLQIDGLSGLKEKFLLNNLCSLPDASYLEIGLWKGGTLIASTYKNEDNLRQIIAIDNWSELGGPREEFYKNLYRHMQRCFPVLKIIENDCFTIDKQEVFSLPVNIFFYDGNHTAESQANAFLFFDSIFSDTFIAVVDDWNWDSVREGTLLAFEKLGYNILYQREIFTTDPNDAYWHTGVYVAVIQK